MLRPDGRRLPLPPPPRKSVEPVRPSCPTDLMRIPVRGSAAPKRPRRLPMFLHVPLPAVVLMLVASGAGMASPGGQSAPLGPAAGSSTAPARAAAAAQPEAPESKQGGDLPGWKQVFEEEFSAGDVRLGGFPGDPYKDRWSAGHRDGTPDTAGQKRAAENPATTRRKCSACTTASWTGICTPTTGIHGCSAAAQDPQRECKTATPQQPAVGTLFRPVQGRSACGLQDRVAPVAGQRRMAARRRDRFPGGRAGPDDLWSGARRY